MSRIRIAPIVEGHGEVGSMRRLLQRIWMDMLGGEYAEVLAPIRQPRTRLCKPEELAKAVRLARLKLQQSSSADSALILVLVDRDPDSAPPCVLGPKWLEAAQRAQADLDIACVLANVEYETWFVAAAESLQPYLVLDTDESVPDNPERLNCGKGWVQKHFNRQRGTYKETVDQPAMTESMDLVLCRQRSPSFDKLCRDLEQRLRAIRA